MRLGAMLLAVMVALSGCSVRTAGAPKGSLTVTAMFDDTQNLVTGHSVQLADVKIGTVTGVKLVGYRCRVTMSIKNGYRLPVGTSAEIAVTSLLGENFVRITMPPGKNLTTGPFLRSGQEITNTSVQPSFEQVVGKAGPLLQAVAGDDVGTIVDTAATALGGQGPKLNGAVAKTSVLLKMVADQRGEITASIDQLARLGRSLAKGAGTLKQAPIELERTTRTLNDNKERILSATANLTRLARLLNDKVLEGRVTRLRTLITQLDPVLKELAGNRQRLTRLINGLVDFETDLPRATYDGQLLLYPLLRFVLPDGTEIPSGSSGSAARQRARQATDPVPGGLRDTLPNLDQILEKP